MQTGKTYVGIDISKLTFDVAIENEGSYRYYKFSNDEEGFKSLKAVIASDAHAIMEASGPYYLRLATYLVGVGIDVSVVNPLVIRRFCQMRLSRTKTDKKDAAMIAAYGKTEQPAKWQPEADYVIELRQLQATCDLLDKNRTSLLRQMEAFKQLPIISITAIKAIKDAIDALQEQIVSIELKMKELVKTHHETMYQQLQTIPGLGPKTSIVLIVISSGFTKFKTVKQLSSYIGTCPRIFESGTSIKGRSRITKMGMSRIRALLYLCSWSAKKCNKSCKELYDRLVENGKSKRLALIAVANKLLKQAFAIATQNKNYDPNYSKNICL